MEDSAEATNERPAPLNALQRRILGVLIEKARTTPDSYPLSLNALVNGCNQKSSRAPVMSLSSEQVEDTLIEMREKSLVAEVHGGGRVPKYRHFGYDYMGVKGVEAAVMTELLLRGEQTAGELRSRASRFEPIADLRALNEILASLQEKQLVVALTPAGRGQLFTHALYEPYEMDSLKEQAGKHRAVESPASPSVSAPSGPSAATPSASNEEVEQLREELRDLKLMVESLVDRVTRLES